MKKKYNRFTDKSGKEHEYNIPNHWQRQKTNRKYYKKHRAEILEKRRKYRQANRERILARRRTLYHRNKSKVKEMIDWDNII